jgi:hypothetical protein
MRKQLRILSITVFTMVIGASYATDIEKDFPVHVDKGIREAYSLRGNIYEAHDKNKLDCMLYLNTQQKSDLTYNTDINQVKIAVDYLKNLAQPKSRDLYYPLSPMEKAAQVHLFHVGFNFLQGKNGLPQDTDYGLEILKFYVHHAYFTCERIANRTLFPTLKKKPDAYTINKFVEALEGIKSDLATQLRNNSRFIPPYGLMGSVFH